MVTERKGKEEYLYSAFSHQGTYRALQAWIMPAFPSWRSPDVTTTITEAADIQLQRTTEISSELLVYTTPDLVKLIVV